MLINPYNYENGKPRIIKEAVDMHLDDGVYFRIHNINGVNFNRIEQSISSVLLDFCEALRISNPLPAKRIFLCL